jgi:hypothetical protein
MPDVPGRWRQIYGCTPVVPGSLRTSIGALPGCETVVLQVEPLVAGRTIVRLFFFIMRMIAAQYIIQNMSFKRNTC